MLFLLNVNSRISRSRTHALASFRKRERAAIRVSSLFADVTSSIQLNGPVHASQPAVASRRIESRPKLILCLCREGERERRREENGEGREGRSKKGHQRRDGIPRFPIVLKSVEAKSKLCEAPLPPSSLSLSTVPSACSFYLSIAPSLSVPLMARESDGRSFDVFAAETGRPARSRGVRALENERDPRV